MEAMCTIEPPWPVMIRAAAWVHRCALVRVVSSMARQSAADSSGSGRTGWMPAQLTRVSSRPAQSAAARTRSAQACSSVRSVASAVAVAPRSSIRRTTLWARSRSRW